MAQIAALLADELTQQSQLAQAKTWLKRAPTMVWGTQAVHGDIAAHRHQWQTAAQFYNQAVDLLADPQATPKSPKPSVIKKVYRLASEAQILAGRLDTIIDSSGKGSGMMRDQVRGVVFKKRLIPIPFESGKITLDEKDQHAVQRLATYLKQKNAAQVTLIGHTDSNGSHALNDNISKQRALAVKKYLQNAGVITKITTIAKGKREPLQLANRAIYVPDEIDVLNRRVEFIAY
jgi:outer membrane protein OmpA-like peptidoglycan-associated protein